MLRRDAPDRFVRVLRQLKAAGCGITISAEALADLEGGGSKGGGKQANILIEIAIAAELFHTADLVAYADMKISAATVRPGRFGVRVSSAGSAAVLRKEEGRSELGGNAGGAWCDRGQGAFRWTRAEGSPSHRRPGKWNNLRRPLRRCLARRGDRRRRLAHRRWTAPAFPPHPGMLPLPVPVRGGSIEDLRPFLNVGMSITQRAKLGTASDPDTGFVLAVAWALAALNPNGPYPV